MPQVGELIRDVRERIDGRMVSTEPIPLPLDEHELAEAAAMSVSERLERSFAWNRFADQLAKAKLRRLR